MKNWEIFYKAMARHAWVVQNNPSNIQTRGEEELEFTTKMVGHFSEAHVYTVQEDVHQLLLLTEGTKDIPHMPFPTMFIDVNFDVEHIHESQFGFLIKRIYGILVCELDKTTYIDEKTKKIILKDGKAVRIYLLCLDDGYVDMDSGRVQGYGFNTINVPQNNWRSMYGKDMNIKVDTVIPKIREYVLNYVSNLMNLLLNKDREIVIAERDYSIAKNKQRIRQGLFPVPNLHVVTPIGKLKQYISEYKSLPSFSYSHSFEVGAHWRYFFNPYFKHRYGQRTWIKPQIRGKGLLIHKVHDVQIQGDSA